MGLWLFIGPICRRRPQLDNATRAPLIYPTTGIGAARKVMEALFGQVPLTEIFEDEQKVGTRLTFIVDPERTYPSMAKVFCWAQCCCQCCSIALKSYFIVTSRSLFRPG